MDSTVEIIKMLRFMGYDGQIPKTLHNIRTRTTSLIWDQLVQNTKARHEIEHIRNNVIIHRLKKKPLERQDEFSYPINEISLYIKKQSLEKKLKEHPLVLLEKQKKVDSLSENNKMKYIMIEQLNNKHKQFEEREFLLEKKCEMLEKQIQESEQLLNKNSGLAKSVPFDDIPNIKNVTAILQENANKFKTALDTVSLPDANITQKNQFLSSKKPNKTSTIFEKHITMTASKSVRKTANKGDCFLKSQNKPENLRKCLFLEEPEVKPKRDSLGLLPLSCFEEEEDDNCMDLLTTIQNNFTTLPSHNVQLSDNITEKLISDAHIREQLRNLLLSHNTHLIWNVLQKMSDDLHSEVVKNIYDQDINNLCNSSQEDISKTHLYHIQIEIKKLQNNITINHMNCQLKKKKEEIMIELSKRGVSINDIENITKLLELLLENVGLDASISAMKKEILAAKSYEQNEDLQIVSNKLYQMKTNIIKKVNSINQYIGIAENTFQGISSTRNKTFNIIRKLNPFILDMDAMEPLINKLNSQEIKVFEQFPLEYNRRCTYTDPSVYYHNICVENFPVEVDSDSLFMLTKMLSTPFNPPEVILLNILKAKRKLDVLLTLRKEIDIAEPQKHSLEELIKQESYLQSAINRLNSLNCSSSSTKTIAVGNNIKKTLEIWNEMSYKNFISTSRLIDGKDYSFYEKQYINYFDNL